MENILQDKFEDTVLRGRGDDRAHQAEVPGGTDQGGGGHRARDRGARDPRQLEDCPLRAGAVISSALRSGNKRFSYDHCCEKDCFLRFSEFPTEKKRKCNPY